MKPEASVHPLWLAHMDYDGGMATLHRFVLREAERRVRRTVTRNVRREAVRRARKRLMGKTSKPSSSQQQGQQGQQQQGQRNGPLQRQIAQTQRTVKHEQQQRTTMPTYTTGSHAHRRSSL